MRARLIHHNDVLKIVDLLRQDHEVVAPFRGRGRDTYFDVVTDANRDQIQIHLPNPYYPPKRYVLPHIQRLLKIRTGADASVEPIHDEKKRAIFGIRSCDVAGIFHTDRFYLGNAFKDNYYEAYRKNLFLVNVACTDPNLDIDTDCFCVCSDTGPAARDHFDLQLMDLGKGEFLAVAGSDKGEALFSQPFFSKATPEHVERRRTILNEVRKLFKVTTSWYSAAIRYITRGGINDDTWKIVGDRCLECGGCSYVCPACTCFTVSEKKTGPNEVERVRMWDACALSGFTRMAGGHNPRQAVHDRRNRRFFRKLAHYFIQRELSMACVGCGRCVSVCHGDVGMPSVVEIIRRLTAGKAETQMSKCQNQNLYEPKMAVMDDIREEIQDVKTFFWHFENPEDQKAFQSFMPGQFAQMNVLGAGEIAISLPPSPTEDKLFFTTRKVGSVTAAMHAMKPGDRFAVRGPYGNGFPMKDYFGRNLIIVAGGIGLIPLRSVIMYALHNRDKFQKIQVFYGSRTPKDLMYTQNLQDWQKDPGFDCHLTVDRADESWKGNVGVVGTLFKKPGLQMPIENTTVFICGPPVMFRFVLADLKGMGYDDRNMVSTLERYMKCGVGKCGHCCIGVAYVCTDGPVFTLEQIHKLGEVI